MKPVDRLSHRLSVAPDSSHFQAFGSDGTCAANFNHDFPALEATQHLRPPET